MVVWGWRSEGGDQDWGTLLLLLLLLQRWVHVCEMRMPKEVELGWKRIPTPFSLQMIPVLPNADSHPTRGEINRESRNSRQGWVASGCVRNVCILVCAEEHRRREEESRGGNE